MKFDCDVWKRAREARRARRDEQERIDEIAQAQWHPWFAWYPVRVGDGDCRWLETVERRVQVSRYYYTLRRVFYRARQTD